MENNDKFEYSYSARQQEEIKRIREKYQPVEEDKMMKLRKLDESVTRKPTIVSLVLGIVGILIFGTGMSLVMVAGNQFFVLGILVGLIGIVSMALAYPLYTKILKAERERIAPEILRLTEELM